MRQAIKPFAPVISPDRRNRIMTVNSRLPETSWAHWSVSISLDMFLTFRFRQIFLWLAFRASLQKRRPTTSSPNFVDLVSI